MAEFKKKDQIEHPNYGRGRPSLKYLLGGREKLLAACYNAKMYAIVRTIPTAE